MGRFDVAKKEVQMNKRLLSNYAETINKLQSIKQNSMKEDEIYKYYMVSRESGLSSINNESLNEKRKVYDDLQKKSLTKDQFIKMRKGANSSLGITRASSSTKQSSDAFYQRHTINQHIKLNDSLNIKESNPIYDKIQSEYFEI